MHDEYFLDVFQFINIHHKFDHQLREIADFYGVTMVTTLEVPDVPIIPREVLKVCGFGPKKRPCWVRFHMCWGLNSHISIISNSRGLYTHCKDSLLKVG